MTIRVTLRAPSDGAHGRLRLVVERARGLVEQQDARPAGDRTRDHDALALSAGQRVHALGNEGVHAHGHRVDVAVEAGEPGGLPCLLERQLNAAADVLVEAAGRQLAVLQHDAELPAHRAGVERIERLAVVEHGAGFGLFEPEQQPEQRGFPLPDGPTIATYSPGAIRRLTLSSTGGPPAR